MDTSGGTTMVMLFKPKHVDLIQRRIKVQTRRVWKHCRVKVGNVYQARTKLFDKGSTFARLKVLAIGREMLLDVSESDAREEGYEDRAAFLQAFHEINGDESNPNPLVWVIKFEVVG